MRVGLSFALSLACALAAGCGGGGSGDEASSGAAAGSKGSAAGATGSSAGNAGSTGNAGGGSAQGGGGSPGVTPQGQPPAMLSVQAVPWNADEAHSPSGQVAAVTEAGDDVIVFSDKGALVYAGGALRAADASTTSWKAGAAATIPAGNGEDGSWAVGVTADGALMRLAGLSELSDETDRYGLVGAKLSGVFPLGSTVVAFAVDGGLGVTDGKTVTRYDVAGASWGGGAGGRLAGVDAQGVVAFDAKKGAVQRWPLAGAKAALVRADGKVVAADATSLYVEGDGGVLGAVFTSTAELHGLASSSSGVWAASGGELVLLIGSTVAVTSGAGIDPKAQLASSPGAYAWVLSGGKATRYAAGKSPDESAWFTTIAPVFSRSCTPCHLPGGTAGHDLSSYDQWVEKRAKIRTRVIDEKTMPPAGTPLADADRMAIDVWTKSSGM